MRNPAPRQRKRPLDGDARLFSVSVVRRGGVPFLKAVEDEFDACGDTELVEYLEQIIADGVLAESEMLRDFPVGKAFSNKADDAFLAFGKKIFQARLQGQGSTAFEGIEQVSEMLAVGPDLPAVHRVNALAKSLEGFVAKDYAAGAGPEGVGDDFALARIEQHDGARPGAGSAKQTEDPVAFGRTFFQLSADDGHVGFRFPEQRESLV